MLSPTIIVIVDDNSIIIVPIFIITTTFIHSGLYAFYIASLNTLSEDQNLSNLL